MSWRAGAAGAAAYAPLLLPTPLCLALLRASALRPFRPGVCVDVRVCAWRWEGVRHLFEGTVAEEAEVREKVQLVRYLP